MFHFYCYTLLLATLLLATSFVESLQETPLHRLASREKRQSASLTCPSTKLEPSTSADDGGKSAFILFYTPKQRKDIKIAYESDGWSQDELNNLMSSGFNTSQPTIMYAHAYLQSARSGWLLDIRSQYDRMFRRDREPTSFNLMFFDWSKYSQLKYGSSVAQVPTLGKVLGEFLQKLSPKYNLNQMHLVGYSLSPHILGSASKLAQVGQITALDPTSVCLDQKLALKVSDAKLVVVRHYDMGSLGAKEPVGGVDIFVNGGKQQPASPRNGGRAQIDGNPLLRMKSEQEAMSNYGQDRFGGSHARAQEHEGQVIDDECHEMAYECPSYERFLAGECADCGSNNDKCYFLNNLNSLHYSTNRQQQKIRSAGYKPNTRMFIRTGSGSPGYCLHHYQAQVVLKPNTNQANKQLLATSTTFDFGPHLQVRFRNQTQENKYTALVVLNKRIPQLGRVSALIDGYRKQDHDDAAQKLLNSVDQFEIIYMSHVLARERSRLSFKLCSSAKGQEKFVKC